MNLHDIPDARQRWTAFDPAYAPGGRTFNYAVQTQPITGADVRHAADRILFERRTFDVRPEAYHFAPEAARILARFDQQYANLRRGMLTERDLVAVAFILSFDEQRALRLAVYPQELELQGFARDWRSYRGYRLVVAG